MNDRTFDPRSSHKLEDPDRLKWLPREEVMASIGLVPGLVVADVGAGTGFFAIPFARVIGNRGKVYAVDFQDEMLKKLNDKLSLPEAPTNIVALKGEALNTTLAKESCDVVFMANIWHELDDHPGVLREAKRLLRPGGRLAILDWRADLPSPPGPPASHRISQADVIDTLVKQGWLTLHSGHVGTYSYLILASR